MPRYFTFDQATRLLPKVELLIRDALFMKAEYQQAATAIEEHSRKIAMMGGTRVNPGAVLAMRERKSQSAKGLQATMTQIHEIGCLVKDLDIGLLDFPTLFNGQEVYLCWRLGETKIEFWHGVQEGFGGRKAIDSDFLAHHRGEDIV